MKPNGWIVHGSAACVWIVAVLVASAVAVYGFPWTLIVGVLAWIVIHGRRA